MTTYPEQITVKVLQHHIDEGTCGNIFGCAVALALREMFPDAFRISTGSRTFRLTDFSGVEYQYSLPGVARCFITYFDDLQSVQPFEFTAHQVEQISD